MRQHDASSLTSAAADGLLAHHCTGTIRQTAAAAITTTLTWASSFCKWTTATTEFARVATAAATRLAPFQLLCRVALRPPRSGFGARRTKLARFGTLRRMVASRTTGRRLCAQKVEVLHAGLRMEVAGRVRVLCGDGSGIPVRNNSSDTISEYMYACARVLHARW